MQRAYTDIRTAIEEGVFRVETPRVKASQEVFDTININVERDIETYRVGRVETMEALPPYIVCNLTWIDCYPELVVDLEDNTAMRQKMQCILHGMTNRWQIKYAIGSSRTSTFEVGANEAVTEYDAKIEFHDVENVGFVDT